MADDETIFRNDVRLPFDPTRFSIPRHPLVCGKINLSLAEFATPLPSCLDMVVKLASDTLLSIPSPYLEHPGVRAFLTLSDRIEHKVLAERYKDYYAYLTIDNRLVEVDTTHRNAGWHFDGMQGARYPKKLPVCHQYIVSDCLPTEFACGSYDATLLNENKHNWFAELGNQVIPEDARFWPEPLEVVLMSAYQLHRSTPSTIQQRRMFMRLDYSLKQQDRLGNTLNPRLRAPWTYVQRDLPAHLQIPVQDTGWANDQPFNPLA